MRTAILTLVVALTIAGCDRRDSAEKANGETNRFNAFVKAGQTTRQQEQAFISAIADDCYQLDRSIRGTSKAEATKAASIAGITSNGNIQHAD